MMIEIRLSTKFVRIVRVQRPGDKIGMIRSTSILGLIRDAGLFLQDSRDSLFH